MFDLDGVAALPCDRRPKRCALHRRYAVVDVETTGIDPSRDGVVEMACAIVERGRVVATWSSLVDPGRPIPPRVTRIHGIADHHVAGAPRFEVAVRELVARCDAAHLVAHNASFDRSFLPPLRQRPWLCTLALARRAYPEAPNHRNQTLRSFLGIDAGSLVAHRALDDALVTAQVLLRCLERTAIAREAARRAAGSVPLRFEAA